jgi:hypothetical protein
MMLLAALAAMLIMVAGSHELLAKKGKAKDCTGAPPKCEAGQRFSRKTCECVPKGAEKQLICHLSVEEAVDADGNPILDADGNPVLITTGEVLSVSVESAHIRVLGKHGDCAPADGAVQGDPCTCDAPTPE